VRDSFYDFDLAVDTYSQYKFVIAFENSAINGYFTEKIINPVSSMHVGACARALLCALCARVRAAGVACMYV
jgi:hypothetical protein